MQKKFLEVKSLYRNSDEYLGKSVSVAGWIRTSRISKSFGFIELNDGSFFKNLQIVVDENKIDNFAEISKLPISSSLLIEGELVKVDNAKNPIEIHATKVVVEGESDSSYPLQKKKHTFEYLRTIAHLRPRSNTFSAVFRVRSVVAYAIHKFFQERNFVYAHTPIITGSDAEGAGEMFRITTLDMTNPPLNEDGSIDFSQDFFGKEANLTVSGQLNGEIMALAFRNIYTFGPTFRAENSYTARHASEFWMVEPEISFADLEDNMELAEDLIKYIINFVLENCPEEMAFFNSFIDKGLLDRLDNIVSSDFVRITYTEAIDLLLKSDHTFEYPVEWGCDLQTEHERYITEQIYNAPVFVTDYPKDIKAFYMRANDDGKTVRAMDLLVPGVGEIIGGSQREERYEVLMDRIKEMGLKEEDYWWYLELRKFGTATHSGFGLGFERIIMYLTGVSNIRDVIPFPRTPKNAEF
ncbi:asparagine--tRNA ligase [Peptostreptococcus porci]|uniref:Asparagine--tRNA ligase n=1 Tax=Peptostreptococcus porci TaxID=2652282 RepID=A0A6N7WZD2_9FIRM|nr:asparagine--tRNA ligase [Peptostreptococcus porci]MDD7182374.1 asparagine--tRNA ligase [Peptostreptococcus porci]MDY5435416.1 asparagine--tRNA ligase [Peptostreptococcus porci]MDY6231058.1 asparagine--tRNA ligase [Peptostreptococcus porci]MST62050.1 asparagine--tRNA ligase [Peptostreptococcus porci]